jgi:hypothetical protein
VLGFRSSDALPLCLRVATFRRSVLSLSSRVKQFNNVLCADPYFLVGHTTDRLPSLATGIKQSYKGKGSTASHHSRPILLLKLKYINVNVSAQLCNCIIRR